MALVVQVLVGAGISQKVCHKAFAFLRGFFFPSATGTTHNGGYNHDAVVYGLSECGVRLVDTAKRYGTEAFVGQAVIDSGIER